MLRILLSANVFILIINVYFLIKPTFILLKMLGNLPTAWGAFLGALVGLCGVAWTTKKGFENLISAQDHRAKIEIEARNHQQALNEATEKQKERRAAKVLASAFIAETGELMHEINNRINSAILMKSMMISFKDTNKVPSITIKPFFLPVWNNSIGSIGLLGASIGGDITAIYSKATGIKEELVIDPPDLKFGLTTYDGIIEGYGVWTLDILHVTKRLTAFICEKDDPGTLFNDRLKRKSSVQDRPMEPTA